MTDIVGAGRDDTEFVVERANVELHCPATGIDDPTTTWRRVYQDSRGRTREQRVRQEGAFTIRCVAVCTLHSHYIKWNLSNKDILGPIKCVLIRGVLIS